MPRFIKLTSPNPKEPVFVRWDQVELITIDIEGEGTYIQFSPESRAEYIIATETPEEVAKLIEDADAAEWGAPPSWLKKQTQKGADQ